MRLEKLNSAKKQEEYLEAALKRVTSMSEAKELVRLVQAIPEKKRNPVLAREVQKRKQEVMRTSTQERKNLKDKVEKKTQDKDQGNAFTKLGKSADSWWEKSNLNWRNWSQTTKSNVKAGTIGLAAAAAVYGLYRFGRWFFTKAKEAGEKTVERTKKGWSILKIAGASVVTGLAIFLGLKGLETYLKNRAIATAKEKVQQLEDLAANGGELTEQQLRELMNARNYLAANKPGSADGRKTESKVAKKKKKIKKKVTEGAEHLRVSADYVYVGRSIVTFQKSPYWDVEPETKWNYVAGIIAHEKNRSTLRMKEMFQALPKGGDVDTSVVRIPDGNKEQSKKAARLVVEYCRKAKPRALKAGFTEKEIDDMSFAEYLAIVASGYQSMGKIFKHIKKSKGDFVDALKQEALSKIVSEDAGMQKEVELILEDIPEAKNVNKATLLATLMGLGDLTVNSFETSEHNKGDMGKVISAIAKKMQQDKQTPRYILPFFHTLFPEDTWDDDMTKNVAVVERMWLNETSISRAVRQFLYYRMMRRGNPAGVVLMQAEVHSHVAEREHASWGLKTKRYQMINRIVRVATSGSWEEWDKMDVEIDKKMLFEAMNKIKGVSGVATLLALLGWFKVVGEGFSILGSVSKEYPIAFWSGAGVLGSTLAGTRVYKHLLAGSPETVKRGLDSLVARRSTNIKLVRGAQSLIISKDSARSARANFSGIYDKIDALTRESSVIGNKVDDALRTCTTATFRGSETAWSDFYDAVKELKGTSPAVDDALDAILKYAVTIKGDKEVRFAIAVSAYPKLSWLGKLSGMPIATAAMLKDGVAQFPVDAFAQVDPRSLTLTPIEQAILMEDEAARLQRYKDLLRDGATLDDLIRSGVHAGDLPQLGSLDDVAKAVSAADEVHRMRCIRQLLASQTADDLIALGLKEADVMQALAATSEIDDAVRLQRIGELLHTRSVDDLVQFFPVDDVHRARAVSYAATEGLPETWKASEVFRTQFNAMRGQYAEKGLQMFDDAVAHLGMYEIAPDELMDLLKSHGVIEVLGDVGRFGENYVDDALKAAVAVAKGPARVQAIERVCGFIGGLHGVADAKVFSPQVLRRIAEWKHADPGLVRKFAQQLISAGGTGADATKFSQAGSRFLKRVRNPRLASQAQKALSNADDMLKAIENAQRLNVLRTGGLLYAGMLGLDVGFFLLDLTLYEEAKKRVEDAQKKFDAYLTPKNGFTKKTVMGRDVYTHTSGVRIESAYIRQQIGTLDDPEEFRKNISLAMAGVTAGGGMLALTAPSLSLGPAGLVVTLSLVTVHGASSVWQQKEQREFLEETPMPVLALLGMAGTVGMDAYTVNAAASNGMVSDMFYASGSEEQKREIRKRAVTILFWQELGALEHDQPGIVAEILKGRDLVSFTRENGDFFGRDYDAIIQPYLSARLFELANDGTALWSEFKDMKIDEGWFDATNVSIQDYRRAVREAAILYVQHLRELRYRHLRRENIDLVSVRAANEQGEKITSSERIRFLAGRDAEDAERAVILSGAANLNVFDVRAGDVHRQKDGEERLPPHEAPTIAQKLVEQIRTQLNASETIVVTKAGGGFDEVSAMSMSTHEATVPRARRAFDANAFMATLPAHVLPDAKKRNYPLRHLAYMAMTEDPPTKENEAENEADRFDFFLFFNVK